MQRLQLVSRGIKRSHGDQIKVRLPITIHHLKLFRMLLAIPSTQNFDSLMIWAAITLAFFGFLRLGELTCNSKFNPSVHLTRDNVVFSPKSGMKGPQFMTMLKFRLGHAITVGATHTDVCPVSALEKYIQQRPSSLGLMFIHASGKPLTKPTLTTETRKLLTRAGFHPSNYAGHSYRISAATTAAEAKLYG